MKTTRNSKLSQISVVVKKQKTRSKKLLTSLETHFLPYHNSGHHYNVATPKDPATAKKGEPFEVTVKMGNEYTHPDDFDHYIESVSLFNGDVLLAKATYVPGTLGNVKAHNTTTFTIIPTGKKLNLVAHGYCTKHGIWEGTPVEIAVAQ